MRLFVSYAREDRDKADLIASRLTMLGHEPWVDKQLTGGQPWWDEVLRQIASSDGVVLGLSPASLRSKACAAEWSYAGECYRPLLPVMVGSLSTETLPPELARLQIIDYVTPGEDAVIRLARALASLPAAPTPPKPLPTAPPVPLSYLNGLARQVSAPTLSFDAQLHLVSQLETGMKSADAEERDAAGALLVTLGERTDLFAETWRRCERLLPVAHDGAPPRGPSTNPPPTPPRPSPPKPAMRSAQSPQPSSKGTSIGVKILAWVGAIFLLLILLGMCAAEGTDQLPCFDYLGNEVPC